MRFLRKITSAALAATMLLSVSSFNIASAADTDILDIAYTSKNDTLTITEANGWTLVNPAGLSIYPYGTGQLGLVNNNYLEVSMKKTSFENDIPLVYTYSAEIGTTRSDRFDDNITDTEKGCGLKTVITNGHYRLAFAIRDTGLYAVSSTSDGKYELVGTGWADWEENSNLFTESYKVTVEGSKAIFYKENVKIGEIIMPEDSTSDSYYFGALAQTLYTGTYGAINNIKLTGHDVVYTVDGFKASGTAVADGGKISAKSESIDLSFNYPLVGDVTADVTLKKDGTDVSATAEIADGVVKIKQEGGFDYSGSYTIESLTLSNGADFTLSAPFSFTTASDNFEKDIDFDAATGIVSFDIANYSGKKTDITVAVFCYNANGKLIEWKYMPVTDVENTANATDSVPAVNVGAADKIAVMIFDTLANIRPLTKGEVVK